MQKTKRHAPKFSRTLLSVAVATALATLAVSEASALTLKVVDGKTNSVIKTDASGFPIGYRWLIQEDQTYDHIAGQQALPGQHLSLSFYKASHPVIATGKVDAASDGDVITVNCATAGVTNAPAGATCVKVNYKDGESRYAALDPAKRYYITVLPDQQFSLGAMPVPTRLVTGTLLANGDPDPNTQTRLSRVDDGLITVPVYLFPIPTAQMSVFIFEDNSPTNNQQDIPAEHGLGGFEVKVIDAGGTYGASGGLQHQDVFGNPIGTEYKKIGGGIATTPAELDMSSGAPEVVTLGPGAVFTGQCDPANPLNDLPPYDQCGVARIRWLAPGKYSAVAYAPTGSGMVQTTTIEGTPVIDAWIKANEPTYFQEFGPPGHHVFTGFVHTGVQPGTSGFVNVNDGKTITGRIVNRHMSRAPQYIFADGEPVPDCWVAVNDVASNRTVYTTPCNADSTFSIPQLKGSTLGTVYTLAIWDKPLDRIFATYNFTVKNSDPATTQLGDIAIFDWFGKIQINSFFDSDTDGFRDVGEVPYSGVGINLRFRDGSIYNAGATDLGGSLQFKEVFPFMFWLGMDIATNQSRVSGMTYVVDGGGGELGLDGKWRVPAHNGWDMPSSGWLTPQAQFNEDGTEAINPNTGNNLSATYADQVFTGAFQLQLGQRMNIDWGRTNWDDPYDPTYAAQVPNWANASYQYVADNIPLKADDKPLYFNGGIGGQVRYGTTRAENNPQDAGAPNHNPGVARVQMNLYRADPRRQVAMYKSDITKNRPDTMVGTPTSTRPLCAADVDNYPFGWSEGGEMGPEDVKQDCSVNTGFANATTWSLNDAIDVYWADSWDDAVPTGCPANPNVDPNSSAPEVRFADTLDCYDNLRNFNQFRPYVAFDGTYAFGSAAGRADLPAGSYIIEAVTPPGYEIQKMGDLSVLNGDSYVPTPELDPSAPAPAPVVGTPIISSGTQVPQCVGEPYVVPAFQTLFPLHFIPNDNWTGPGQTLPKCDRKLVRVTMGANSASDFHMFTEVPIAAQSFGMILDDTANEFDPASPNFGEKYAPPHMPVSLRDWAGKEIHRVYSDQYGRYNFLAPSTFTANVPNPSGMSPNVLQACMNSPGPIPVLDANGDPTQDANGNPVLQIDPQFDRRYSQWCYQMQYLTGKVTFLDTPVVPVAAFAGADSFPVDCEYDPRTPTIYSVNGSATGAYSENNGPWLPSGGGRLQIISVGTAKVANPNYDATDPASAKLIDRDFGFGNAGSVTLTAADGTVTTLSGSLWSNDLLDVAVPDLADGEYQLDVYRNADNGQTIKSRMGITLHVGGSQPILVSPGVPGAIQTAIDLAEDGALIMVPPGNYEEMLIMWKKVRLQGWGAFSTHLNPIKYPYENLQAWRDKVGQLVRDGLVSLAPGQATGPFNNQDNAPVMFDGQEGPGVLVLGNNNVSSTLTVPAESVLASQVRDGEVTTLMAAGLVTADACVQTATNRNLCEIQTPGASLTGVVRAARNVIVARVQGETCTLTDNFPGNANDLFACSFTAQQLNTQYWANAPYGSVDGISVFGTDTGGGIALNAYTNHFQVSNNRLASNYGLYGGGIRLGALDNLVTNANGVEVYSDAQNNNTVIDRNQVILGGSEFGGGGGVMLYSGANSYQVTQNWMCGNFTMGNGGGIAQIGLSRTLVGSSQSRIENNLIAFNQSFFQGNEVHGGGVFIGGQPSLTGAAASAQGVGNISITGNTILGNNAGAGDGGGIALAHTSTNPGSNNGGVVTLGANIIANNVAGAAGGGISVRDYSRALITGNEVAQNDSTATTMSTFTLGNPNTSVHQPAGVVVRNNSRATLNQNRIVENRSFQFGLTSLTSFGLMPAMVENPVAADTIYWDLARMGNGTVVNGSNNTLTNVAGATYLKYAATGASTSCAGTGPNVVTATTNSAGCTNTGLSGTLGGDASLYVDPGFNGARNNGTVLQAEATTGNGAEPAAAFDEGGNWINVHYGPLGLIATDAAGGTLFDANGKPTSLRNFCQTTDLNCESH